MKDLSYSKALADKAVKATGIKYVKLEAGTRLTVLDVLKSDENENRHSLLCQVEGGRKVRIPVREFINMTNEDGSGSVVASHEDDEDSVVFPSEFAIKSSEDRMFGDKTLYPLNAYAGSDQFIKDLDAKKNPSFEELLKTEKANHGYDPVQNYTIEIL